MSDWTDTLDARRAGRIEGFHDANSPIGDLEPAELPATGALAPESDAPAPPALPVESPTGGHRRIAGDHDIPTAERATRAPAKKAAAKRSSSARKRS